MSLGQLGNGCISLSLLRASLCNLFMCESLGFLTAWWPQDGQPTYLTAQASSPSTLVNQAEAASCFMGQCWKSSVLTSVAFCWLWASHSPSDSRREDTDLTSQWEECQGHSTARRLGHVVATIFGRYNLPHRAHTNMQGGQDKLRQKEVLWLLTLTPTHYLLSTQNQPFPASMDPQTLWAMKAQERWMSASRWTLAMAIFGSVLGNYLNTLLSFTHLIWFF